MVSQNESMALDYDVFAFGLMKIRYFLIVIQRFKILIFAALLKVPYWWRNDGYEEQRSSSKEFNKLTK